MPTRHVVARIAAAALIAAVAIVGWRARSGQSETGATSTALPVRADSPGTAGREKSAGTTSTTTTVVAPTRTGPDGTIEPVSAEYPRAFQVNVSETPRPGSALDALNAADAAAKQGDAQAAYAMFVAIKRCQEPLLARDMRDLEAARSRPADYQRLLERNETTLRECAGVGPEEIARGYAGLMLAAERGDVLASLVYATTGSEAFSGSTTDMLSAPEKLIEYRQNAMRFLHAAADRGSVQAMQALANAYARGVITTRDPVKSYVYTYAEYLLAPADPLARRQADDAGSGLSAEQIGAAQGQARAMLERCCR